MNMPSVMQGHNFSQVPKAEIQRSSFNRNHNYKTTFDSGYLVPCFVDEVLPGDTFNVKATMFARLTTPIVPIMDNLFLDTFYFFVPNRLLWQHWEQFNGYQANPGDSTSYLVPQVTGPSGGGFTVGSLFDYFGIPTGVPGLLPNALHSRAYNLIYNEWFRDQNLQNSVTVDTGDGPDNPANYVLLRRGKRHDYFTSALPWPQKGTAVSLPLGNYAPVGNLAKDGNAAGVFRPYSYADFVSAGVTPLYNSSTGGATIPVDPGSPPAPNLNWTVNLVSNSGLQAGASVTSAATTAYLDDSGSANYVKLGIPFGHLTADISSATASTINQLRQAFQIQRMYERDARGGTRYTEIIRAHFGVTSPDARLQRPEYLGGGSQRLNITPVPQTSVTAATPQGNLAGFGTVGAKNGFVKSFTEHGVLIGLVNVRADLNYQQGLNKMWSRQTRFDFYWPALSHLGEQAVLNQEIYAVGSSGNTDAAVFGYQERYAEYRYKPSVITGQFRSTYSTPLDVWHLAQKFTSLPSLNSTFIQDTPPVARILAVPVTGAQFYFDSYWQCTCARPMPTYGVPGMIDHF